MRESMFMMRWSRSFVLVEQTGEVGVFGFQAGDQVTVFGEHWGLPFGENCTTATITAMTQLYIADK